MAAYSAACCLNCLNHLDCSLRVLRVELVFPISLSMILFAFQSCWHEFASEQFNMLAGASVGSRAIVDCLSCVFQCAAAIVESFVHP